MGILKSLSFHLTFAFLFLPKMTKLKGMVVLGQLIWCKYTSQMVISQLSDPPRII
jgi:hypothetical protein